MIKIIILSVIGIVLIAFGFVVGSNLTYEEPICPECVQKPLGSNSVVCEVCKPTNCVETTNAECIDQTNSTYILGLIRQIKRCEGEVRHYADSNNTAKCVAVKERLQQCLQTLNQTRKLLEY